MTRIGLDLLEKGVTFRQKVLLDLNVTEKDLIGFERDLWKDARKLKVSEQDGRKHIRRYSDQQTSARDEFQFITGIADTLPFRIPSIVDHSNLSITFEYIAGTRAFNLLMDLRALYRREQNNLYHTLGIELIDRLAENLLAFQDYFLKRPQTLATFDHYPAREKLANLYGILTSVLSLSFDPAALYPITEIYEKGAVVPFRDATTKNVILDLPTLFKKRFKSNEERLQTIKKQVLSGELADKLTQDTIYHIDFSGCCFLCPAYDDWVALREHEAAAWLQLKSVPEPDTLSTEDLCVKFVRYSRFGGRKLAYRLLNHQGYQIRFGLDSEAFYFSALKQICRLLKQQEVLTSNTLASLMAQLEKATSLTPDRDYFHAWKKSNVKHGYYSDVFPG